MRRQSSRSSFRLGATLKQRHRLAVRAAALDGEAGEQAFASWRKLVPLDHADDDEFRLLPLIYLQAQRRGCSVAEMGRLKGVYRQVWVRNTLQLHTCVQVVRLLAAAAIPSILIKGIAMFACWSANVGPRPMRDIDILVHRTDVRRAARLLGEHGWRCSSVIVERLTEADLDCWHGAPLIDAEGRELDLHWRALPRNTAPDHVSPFWSESLPREVLGETVRVLRPEDQLYHTLLHGARWTDGAGLDWMLDVVSLLKACPEGFDWDRVRTYAERDRSVPSIKRQVRQFEAVLGIELPIAGALNKSRWTLLDGYVARRFRQPSFVSRPEAVTPVNFHDELVRRRDGSGPRAFMRFVCKQWALERPAELFPEALFRCLGRPAAARRWLARSGIARHHRADSYPEIGAAVLSDPERSPFVSGWSGPERNGRWTSDDEAILAFADKSPRHGDLRVVLRATPYLVPRHTRLDVDVFANGRRRGGWCLEGDAWTSRALTFTVPEAVRRLSPDILVLVVSMRRLARPALTGTSKDTRRLGLFLESISLGHVEVADPFAAPIGFTGNENDSLLVSGWSSPEPTGRWTDGPHACLDLQWPGYDEAIEVRLVGRLFAGTASAERGLDISANGTPSKARIETIGRAQRAVALLYAEPVRTDRGSRLILDLSFSQPRSPLSFGLSNDARQLGFLLESLELYRVDAKTGLAVATQAAQRQ